MSRKEKARNERKKRFARLKRVLIFIILIVAITSVAYVGYVGAKMYVAWDKIQSESRPGPNMPAEEEERGVPQGSDPFTVLILGIDDKQSAHMQGLSDVVMVAVVNPETKKVSLLSIPRDTYTELVGLGYKDKINHAYSYGGIDMAVDTVENFLDINIDYWTAINLDGFSAMIDLLGGLKINAEKDMYHHYVIDNITIDIKKGETVLNAEEAMFYVRYRGDAEGDFGRNRRQQQVIKALLDQTLEMRNVTKVGEIIEVIGDNFRTNIPAGKMLAMVRQFASLSGKDIESISTNGDPGYLNGTAYVFFDEEEHSRIQRELKELLNPDLGQLQPTEQTQGDHP